MQAKEKPHSNDYAMFGDAAVSARTQAIHFCSLPTAIYARQTWKSVAETRNFLDAFMQEMFTKYPVNVAQRSRDQRRLIA